MDLEHELRRLDVAWPETPAFRFERRRRRWPLALAVAAAALAAVLAVPQSRGAVLRFLHLGAATIERVETLPPAVQRPLERGLGQPVSPERANLVVDLHVPPGPTPRLYLLGGNVVSMVLDHRGEPVLLSELGDVGYFKKVLAGETAVERVRVGAAYGFWIHGARHDVFLPDASPRLAGNTLVWVEGRTTYRLEGRALTREGALDVARSLRGYP